MSLSTAYAYTCQFCNVVQGVFTSLQIANKAASAAYRGDHGEAKAIIIENRI